LAALITSPHLAIFRTLEFLEQILVDNPAALFGF
jgi:hypothetical protein